MRDCIVAIAQKLGLYHALVKLLTKWENKKMAKRFLKYGLETLVQANKAFESCGAHMFFAFGTLLGAFREKNFIPYDFDLDVGILSSERPENMDEIMASYGFSKKRQFYVKETGRITEDQYEYKGVQIDVFYQFEKDEHTIYSYVGRRHETKEWKEANQTDGFPCVIWEYEKSELKKTEFLGSQFYMPVKTEQWLRTIYGDDFMTPIRDKSAANLPTSPIHSERLYRR